MPLMQSPYVGKPVDVSDEQVDGFLASGFVLVEPVKPVEKKPAPKRKGK